MTFDIFEFVVIYGRRRVGKTTLINEFIKDKKAKEERIVLVIDEYPYMPNCYSGISSLLASFIDHKFLNSKLMLILCGSSLSFMENQVLGYQSLLLYCEKPMSHNVEEAQKMIDAWKASGMKFTVGYQNRFRAEVLNLHEACTKGELGDIYFAKAHALRRRGGRHGAYLWIKQLREAVL